MHFSLTDRKNRYARASELSQNLVPAVTAQKYRHWKGGEQETPVSENTQCPVNETQTSKLDRRALLQHSLAGGAALAASTLLDSGFVSQSSAMDAAPIVEATWDTDLVRQTPVPHRYVHGLIRSHVKFQVLLPSA